MQASQRHILTWQSVGFVVPIDRMNESTLSSLSARTSLVVLTHDSPSQRLITPSLCDMRKETLRIVCTRATGKVLANYPRYVCWLTDHLLGDPALTYQDLIFRRRFSSRRLTFIPVYDEEDVGIVGTHFLGQRSWVSHVRKTIFCVVSAEKNIHRVHFSFICDTISCRCWFMVAWPHSCRYSMRLAV
jgi:hypothetical protein